MASHSRRVLAASLLSAFTAVPCFSQSNASPGDEVYATGFETIPAGTRIFAPAIGLQGNVDVSGTLKTDSVVFPDGTVQTTAFHPAAATVVTVSPVPFDPVASGQALRDAVANILDASASRRYLIRLEPGIYDVRSATDGNSLALKPWVSLEGSGETVTEIRSGGFSNNFEGTIETADHSELRRVTVRNTGGSAVAIAVLVTSGPTALDHVTAIAFGGTNLNYGIRHTGSGTEVRHFDVTAEALGGATAYGVTVREVDKATFVRLRTRASGASDNVGLLIFDETGFGMEVVLESVEAEALGPSTSSAVRVVGEADVDVRRSRLMATGGSQNFGVETLGQAAALRLSIQDSDVVASSGDESYGVFSESASTVDIDHSRVTGETSTFFDGSGGLGLFRVGATRLAGGPVSGAALCAFVYDQDYNPLSGDCSASP